MRDFEQRASSHMSSSERMDELASVLAYALIRILVSSDAEPTARQGAEQQKCTDKDRDLAGSPPSCQA